MLPKLSQSVSDSLHPYSTYRNFELVHTVYVCTSVCVSYGL